MCKVSDKIKEGDLQAGFLGILEIVKDVKESQARTEDRLDEVIVMKEKVTRIEKALDKMTSDDKMTLPGCLNNKAYLIEKIDVTTQQLKEYTDEKVSVVHDLIDKSNNKGSIQINDIIKKIIYTIVGVGAIFLFNSIFN